MKKCYITKECRQRIREGDTTAMSVLVKHYEAYIKIMAKETVEEVFGKENRSIDKDMIQEFITTLLQSVYSFEEKNIREDIE